MIHRRLDSGDIDELLEVIDCEVGYSNVLDLTPRERLANGEGQYRHTRNQKRRSRTLPVASSLCIACHVSATVTDRSISPGNPSLLLSSEGFGLGFAKETGQCITVSVSNLVSVLQ